MNLHLCRCSAGPHADAPEMEAITAGALVVVHDNSGQVHLADVGRAFGPWIGEHGVHVVVLHDGITLESLTAEQLASVGLQVTRSGGDT